MTDPSLLKPKSLFARRMERVAPSAIMELIKTTAAGDYISFASGLPDPGVYPTDLLRGIADDVLTRDGRAALQYGPAEGFAPLRALAAEMLGARGLQVTPEQVLITTGSQQAIDLAARGLLDPGDHVLIESPSYLAAVQAFDSYEAVYHPVPVDRAGMDVEAAAAAQEAKLLYTLPNFQNPTGLTLPLERRRQLADLAATRGWALLEDDAYHDLRYEGEALPPVCGLAENPWAVYTGTFSKVVAPGVRVGYLAGSAAVVERLAQLKQITDLHTGSFTQRIVHEFCARGHLAPAVDGLRDTYQARRDVMLAALDSAMPAGVTWTRPEGGMFIWVTLPPGRCASELLARVMARGVVFVPGTSFHPGGGGENTLRLNFVSAGEERIRAGIRILGETLKEWLAH